MRKGTQDVVFSVCIVRRGAVGARVKSSTNSYWNSTILYNYQFVFIETISAKC